MEIENKEKSCNYIKAGLIQNFKGDEIGKKSGSEWGAKKLTRMFLKKILRQKMV